MHCWASSAVTTRADLARFIRRSLLTHCRDHADAAKSVNQVVRGLGGLPLVHQKAKDLLRASALTVLTRDNLHGAKDLENVEQGSCCQRSFWFVGASTLMPPLRVADF